VIIGKTVTTEFAVYGPGKTRNPHHPDHTPGGSSSGSAAAVADGAVAVMVAHEVPDLPCLVVSDPVVAFGRIAAWYRRENLTATVVGITGSAGKTTTKDLIADVLEGDVVAAEGSFNTEVGVPLTIMQADEDTEFLVLEMGMRGLGHIAYLADLARPEIGVVLNVGSAHLGMMKGPQDIALAKGELIESLSHDGRAVLNADDPQVARMAERTAAKVLWFGGGESADVKAGNVTLDSAGRPSFDLSIPGEDPVRVCLQLHGEHFVESALAAASVGYLCGMTAGTIARRLTAAVPRSRWRMEVTETEDGITIISDAYNANPESMRAAIKALRSMAGERRSWAVLGEMRELGDHAQTAHDDIGRLAVRLDISRLVCVGDATKVMHLAASNEGSWGEESTWVPDADAAAELLEDQLRPGDIVLVKASRAVGLEVVAERLLQRHGRSA
ncbi:MAG: UDP-N-acetylmuramoyl-tripeptide--D-alanyl-D-alanine ligase, partial [Candidatus Nanopelagicales bacterium]